MRTFTKLFAVLVCMLSLTSFVVNAQSDYNLKRAYELIREEDDNEGALKLIAEQLKITPNNSEALLLRARILGSEGSYGDALSDVNLALKVNKPKKSGIPNSTLCWWKAILYKDLEEVDLAIKAYSEALAQARKDNKDNVQDISFEYAQMLYFDERYSEAESVYRQMLADDETDVAAMTGLARNMLKGKNYEGARDILLKAIRFESEYSSAYKFLARAYAGLGENDKSIDSALSYFEKDEDSNTADVIEAVLRHKSYGVAKIKENIRRSDEPQNWRYLLTDLYEETEEYDLAIKEYNEIEKDFGKSSTLDYYRACCYSGLGLYSLALRDIEKCLEEDDEDLRILHQKAYNLRELGRYEESNEIVDKMIDLAPTNGFPYYLKGLNYEMMGDLDKAYELYDQGIDIDKDYPYLYLMRGEILLDRGDTKKAMEDFEAIIQRDTTYDDGSCRQYALHFLGKDDEAMQWMDSLIVNNPYDPGQYYDKACLLSRMGKADQSVEALKKALEMGYARFTHMDHDDDLDLIRDREDFKELVAKYKAELQKKVESLGLDLEQEKETMVVEVPIVRRSGGTFDVECHVNGLPLNMIFDTGASDVTISKVEADFMLKNKYLSQNDIKGKQYYQIANGDISEGTVITLREVKIGDATLHNVNASVVKNQKAPLLLGESVLSKFGTFTVDNINSKLIIKQ